MEFPKYVKSRNSIIYRGMTYYKCIVCSKSKEYTHAEMDYHLLSQEHKKNMEKQKEYYCEVCKLQCNRAIDYTRHINTKGHKQKASGEVKPELKCEPCGVKFLCNREQERHLLTKKHAKRTPQT